MYKKGSGFRGRAIELILVEPRSTVNSGEAVYSIGRSCLLIVNPIFNFKSGHSVEIRNIPCYENKIV